MWFRINYSWNWEWLICFDQRYVNRTETVHVTLCFLYLSHLLYGIRVNIFIMNRYISKSYTRSKNTIYRAGAAVVSTITSNKIIIIIIVLRNHLYFKWSVKTLTLSFGRLLSALLYDEHVCLVSWLVAIPSILTPWRVGKSLTLNFSKVCLLWIEQSMAVFSSLNNCWKMQKDKEKLKWYL